MNTLALSQGASELQGCLFKYPEPVSPKDFIKALRSVPEFRDTKFKGLKYEANGVLYGLAISKAFEDLSPLDRVRLLQKTVDGLFPKEEGQLPQYMIMCMSPEEINEINRGISEITRQMRS